MLQPEEVQRISELMKALSNPVRLELLQLLQSPKPISELRLTPRRKEDSAAPARVMSRAAVKQHLDHLLAIGAVERVPNPYQRADHYQTSATQMFVLAQILMDVGRTDASSAAETTMSLANHESSAPGTRGVMLVNGIYEGRWFPLRESDKVDGGWVIGRDEGAAISLPFDPYVSLHHAFLRDGSSTAPGTTTVEALDHVRNPLTVDWQPVAPGVERVLERGGILHVGRSTLVYRD